MTLPPKTNLVVGLDPGLGRLGYAVLQGTIGNPQIITFGCFETSPKESHAIRLVQIGGAVESLLKKYQPTVIGIERLFFSKNVKTALVVGEARGVISYMVQKNHCRLAEFSPQEVKLAATGQGRADKKQVQKMLKLIFNLPALPKPDDAADALALALCALGVKQV